MLNNDSVIKEMVELENEQNIMFEDYLKSDYDDVLDLAMEMENHALELYKSFSNQIDDIEVAKLFQELIKEEEAHIDVLSNMIDIDPEKIKIGKIKEIDLQKSIVMRALKNSSVGEILLHAITLEKDGAELFKKLARNCDKIEKRDLFVKLSRIELSHKNKLQQLYKNYYLN